MKIIISIYELENINTIAYDIVLFYFEEWKNITEKFSIVCSRNICHSPCMGAGHWKLVGR